MTYRLLLIGLLLPFLLFFASSNVYAFSSDGIVQIITHPLLVSLLLSVGITGIVLEFIFPGLIIPATIGIGAFGLYFIGHFLAGSIGWGVPSFFVMGLFLFILEMFIPNFGILGIIGFLLLSASFLMAAPTWQVGALSLFLGLGISVVFLWILSRFVSFKTVWHRLVLKKEQRNEEGYASFEDRSALMGQQGITITPLRPSGFVQFEDRVEDVVSEGRSITSQKKVRVVAVEGVRVIVREVED